MLFRLPIYRCCIIISLIIDNTNCGTITIVIQVTDAELFRAFSILSFFANSYVWYGGEADPAKVLPASIAVPLWDVSKRLGMFTDHMLFVGYIVITYFPMGPPFFSMLFWRSFITKHLTLRYNLFHLSLPAVVIPLIWPLFLYVFSRIHLLPYILYCDIYVCIRSYLIAGGSFAYNHFLFLDTTCPLILPCVIFITHTFDIAISYHSNVLFLNTRCTFILLRYFMGTIYYPYIGHYDIIFVFSLIDCLFVTNPLYRNCPDSYKLFCCVMELATI